MEKKFKFSDNPTLTRTVYGVVIAILCISAIIVGIVAANNRKKPTTPNDENPPITDGGTGNDTGNENTNPPAEDKKEPLSFISPVSGKVVTTHSTSIPVFSETLEEWRIHTGIDISCAEGADIFACADGVISAVRSDALLGQTVEITHEGGIKSIYSNLDADSLPTVGASVKCGEKIGTVGYSSISELADEAHLHFGVKLNDVSVNPLDYISEEAKRVSLGISESDEV